MPPPQLDDLGTATVLTEAPVGADIVPFYDVSEFGNSRVKKTTISSLISGGLSGGATLTGPFTFTHTAGPVIEAQRTTVGTSAIAVTGELTAISTGDAADGFGPVMTYRISDTGVSDELIGSAGFVRAGADNTGAFVVRPQSGGSAAEQFRIGPTGGVTMGTVTTGVWQGDVIDAEYLGVSGDADAIAFAAATGIPDSGLAAINRCLAVLTEGGIRDELVDLFPCAAGINSVSSPKTLMLATVTVEGSPDIGVNGLVFTGTTAERAYFGVASTPVFTLAVDARISDGVAADAVYAQFANSAGLGTAGTLLHLASYNGMIMTAASGNYANSGGMNGTGHGFFVSGFNLTDQIIVISNDNEASPTVKGYGNGALLITDSSGNNVTASPINRLTLGAFSVDSAAYQNPFKGSIRSAAIFNRVLTDAEAKTATKALRQLDLRNHTLITYGDSQTAQLSISGGSRYKGNWPLQYTRSYPTDERVRLHNAAVDSMAADLGITSFTDLVTTFAPDGDGVNTGTIILAFGTNDIDDGASAATILARLQTLAASARAIGLRVICCTCMHNTYFSGGQETIRQALNTLILADTVSWDAVWGWSDIIGTAHDAGLWLDSLHLNNAGNLALAANLAAGGFPRVTAFT